MDVRAVHPLRQPGTRSRCLPSAGCSHLCLPRPQGETCACPGGLRLRTGRWAGDEAGSFSCGGQSFSGHRGNYDLCDLKSRKFATEILCVGLALFSPLFLGFLV